MHSSGQSLRLGFQDHWLTAGRLGQYATDWGLGDWVPCSVVLDFGRFDGVIDSGGLEGFLGRWRVRRVVIGALTQSVSVGVA